MQTVTGYRVVQWKQVLAIILSVFTIGFLAAIFYVRRHWWIKFVGELVPLKTAVYVLVEVLELYTITYVIIC